MKGWCCTWHSSCCICVFSCGKALRLPVSATLMQVGVLTGTCASTCKEFSVSKKHKFITNPVERDTYSRFLSTQCDWMDGVFFLHTFTPRKKTWLMCEWDDNHASPAPVLETTRSFNVELPKAKKQNAVGRRESENRHVNWLYNAGRLEKSFLCKSCSKVIYSERNSVTKSSTIEH